jgi:glycosyltransferase involved in cell wall biosynthesis
MAKFMERMSFHLASHVISTNESYREIAINRGLQNKENVTVVRNGPDPADFIDIEPDQSVKKMAPLVVGYLGNMNPQDGVDRILGVANILINERKQSDIAFLLIGSGDSYQDLVMQRDRMGLRDQVMMTGRIPWTDVLNKLAATDICVQPDPPGGLNDNSTMNKLMDYMMLGKAVVSYDLTESRVSGGDSVWYVKEDSIEALADAVSELAGDREQIAERGKSGMKRAQQELAWQYQAVNLLNVYKKLFPLSDLSDNENRE